LKGTAGTNGDNEALVIK